MERHEREALDRWLTGEPGETCLCEPEDHWMYASQGAPEVRVTCDCDCEACSEY